MRNFSAFIGGHISPYNKALSSRGIQYVSRKLGCRSVTLDKNRLQSDRSTVMRRRRSNRFNRCQRANGRKGLRLPAAFGYLLYLKMSAADTCEEHFRYTFDSMYPLVNIELALVLWKTFHAFYIPYFSAYTQHRLYEKPHSFGFRSPFP